MTKESEKETFMYPLLDRRRVNLLYAIALAPKGTTTNQLTYYMEKLQKRKELPFEEIPRKSQIYSYVKEFEKEELVQLKGIFGKRGSWLKLTPKGENAYCLCLGEGKLNLLAFLANLMDVPDIKPQAASSLVLFGRMKPNDVLPKLVEKFKDRNRYSRHMAAYALGEIGKVRPELVLPFLREFIMSDDRLDRREGLYALRQIGKLRPEEALDAFEDAIRDTTDPYTLADIVTLSSKFKGPLGTKTLPLLGRLKRHEHSLVAHVAEYSIRKISEPKKVKGRRTIRDVSILLMNSKFQEGLSGWGSTSDVSYRAMTNISGQPHCVEGVETRVDNLGRLYQDLTDALISGNTYKFGGWIKTLDVEAYGVRGGAAIGVDYVDDEGWTPPGGFIMERGFVKGTTEWSKYVSDAFTLPSMPEDCDALWFLLDFNDGKGTAWWADLWLTEIKRVS